MTLPAMPSSFSDWREGLRQASQRVQAIGQGRSNATGDVTLTQSATSTAVTDARVAADSVITMMPTTANAATAIATTYIGTVANGSFTITHANTADSDKTFKYAIQG